MQIFCSDKSLPELIISQQIQMYNDSIIKPLPIISPKKEKTDSIRSNNTTVYQKGGSNSFDSAIDLVVAANNSSSSTLFLPKYYQYYNPNSISSKPLPSIHYNPVRNTTIIHVKKVKY
jgi:hypothetical protein